jgi:hypothetical protein
VIDLLTVAQLGSAVLALLVTGLMAAGFARLALRATGLVGGLAKGILVIHMVAFLRTFYRDILPLFVDPGSWVFSESSLISETLVLNVLVVLAGWHGLKALYLAIPESVRGRYSLLTAALYPPLRRRPR